MSSSWVPTVRHVADGEAVRAAVASRAPKALEKRTDYLKSRLDEASLGAALFSPDQTLAPDLLPGTPVFFNNGTQRFEAAYASYTTDTLTGVLKPSPSSYVAGVIYSKTNNTLGTLLTLGMAELDISNQVDGDPAGPYHLSSQAGKFTEPPAIGPLVLLAIGSKVLFIPSVRDFADGHAHYKLELHCRPAGDHDTAIDPDRHTIENGSSGVRGWLPADHSVFNGKAPSNAVFGYNLSQDGPLSRLWPPGHLNGASLMWDHGVREGATEVPLGSQGLAILNRYGIWWLSDLFADVPWPNEDFEEGRPLSGSYSSSSEKPETPRHDDMRITVYFTKSTVGTEHAAVTSLSPAEDSPIEVLDCDGVAAFTGDLYLRLKDLFSLAGVDSLASLAVKEQNGQKFVRGPIISGLHAADSTIILSGEDTVVVDGKTYEFGLVSVQVDLEPGDKLLPPINTYTDDTPQRLYQDVTYLGFPNGQVSSLRSKVVIPVAGLSATPKLSIRLVVIGVAAGTTPNLALVYRRIPSSSAAATIPTVDTVLGLTMATVVTAGQYYEVESSKFTVAAGDLVFFELSRTDSDGYAGEVGIIDQVGVLAAS